MNDDLTEIVTEYARAAVMVAVTIVIVALLLGVGWRVLVWVAGL